MAKPPYVAQYLPRLLNEGLSLEEIQGVFRGQGINIGKRRLGTLIGETQFLMGNRETLAQLPLNRKISPTEVGQASRPKARGPLVNVELAIWDPDVQSIDYHTWGVRSSEWMSPAWYIQTAIDDWIATSKLGRGTPEGTPLGGVIGGAVELVGEESIGEEL